MATIGDQQLLDLAAQAGSIQDRLLAAYMSSTGLTGTLDDLGAFLGSSGPISDYQAWLAIPDMTPTGTVHVVSTDAEMRTAWKNLVAGDVIELAAGVAFGEFYFKAGPAGTPNYGQVKCGSSTASNASYTPINLDASAGEFVLIRSADPSNRASFPRIQCIDSQNTSATANGIRFENVDVINSSGQTAISFITQYCRYYGTKVTSISGDPASGAATNTRPVVTHDSTLSNYKTWSPTTWLANTETGIFLQGGPHYIAHCNIIATQNPIIMEESTGSDGSLVNDVSVEGYAGDCFRGNGIGAVYQDCWVRNTYHNDSSDHYDGIQIANSSRQYIDGIYRRNVFLGWDANHGRGLFDQGDMVYYSAATDYAVGDYVFGSDRLVYIAVAINGPSSTVQDPTTDATDTYWELSLAIPASEQGFWSSDDPANWICEDNVLLQGGYQGANLGSSANNNTFQRNTIQFIAPSPGYNPPARVYQTGSDTHTTETRIGGGSWSSVSENIYDANISGTDDGDNQQVSYSNWSSWFADALNRRDFHVLPTAANQNVGPTWLRYVSKTSPAAAATTLTSPTPSTLGLVDEFTCQFMFNIDLSTISSQNLVRWDSDGAGLQGRVLLFSNGSIQAQAKGTSTVSAVGVVPTNTDVTIRVVAIGSTGVIRVYVDNTLVVTHTAAAFVIGDTYAMTFLENAAAVFDFNYLWMWYSAESDGTAPFRVPDKMIYGSPATVNADSWATGADFT